MSLDNLKYLGKDEDFTSKHKFVTPITNGMYHRWGNYRYPMERKKTYTVTQKELNEIEKIIIKQEAKYRNELAEEKRKI